MRTEIKILIWWFEKENNTSIDITADKIITSDWHNFQFCSGPYLQEEGFLVGQHLL